MTKDDDELSFDFSKITGLFGKKKEKKPEEPHTVKQVEKVEHKIESQIEKKKEEIKDLKKQEEKLEEVKEKIYEKKAEEKAEKEVTKVMEKVDEESVKESSDEISFDISGIKNMFSGKKEKKESDDDDVSFDFGKAMHFVKKYHVILLVLIPIILSIYARGIPADLPVTDDWARTSVYNFYQNQIQSQVNAQFPHLPEANKDALVEEEFERALSEQKATIDEQIRQTSNHFKSRLQDENGDTYLVAIDPYFWLRKAQNIVDHGYPGDEIRDGENYNTFMYAPKGRFMVTDIFHAHVIAFFYRIGSIFNPSMSVMSASFFTPLIIMTLAAIPAFFIGRLLLGNIAGLTASIITIMHPAIMTRTAAGFSDTDSYNILFPLTIAWIVLMAFRAKTTKSTLIYAAIAGFITGLYSVAWGGWWFMLHFVTVLLVGYAVFVGLAKRSIKESLPTFKHIGVVLIAFIVLAGITTSVVRSPGHFIDAPLAPLSFVTIKDVGVSKIWPNVHTTVAEQNEVSMASIINQVGGKFLFILALLGILLLITRLKTKRDYLVVGGSLIWWVIALEMTSQDPIVFIGLLFAPYVVQGVLLLKDKDAHPGMLMAILLAIWLGATLYASTKGIRWVLLMAPAYAMGVGATYAFVYQYASEKLGSVLHIKPMFTKAVVGIILIFLVFPQVAAGLGAARNEIPSMNDAWFEALDKINREAAPDAIINSWWDFGHWFKTIGNRATTFDGASQNTPMAHWIGNALLTSDEKESVGILRMLDCSSNDAFDKLDAVVQKPYRTVEMLYDIIVLEKGEAKAYLEDEGLTVTQADNVLESTHCEPPENYFIASEDMIGKSGVWGHFGSWNFRRATMFNQIKNVHKTRDQAVVYLTEEFGMTESEAADTYFQISALSTSRQVNDWLAPWPGYTSGRAGCQQQDGPNWVCAVGVHQGTIQMQVNVETGEIDIPGQTTTQHPNVVGFIGSNGEYQTKTYNENTVGLGVSLIPTGDSYNVVLSSPETATSMFNRLFYYGGHGLKYFSPFTSQQTFNGQNIHVYSVDWTGSQNNVMSAIQERIESQTEIEASHILVNSSEQAQEILDLLEGGEEFEALARAFSIDPSAQINGGNLGYFRRGVMVPEFEQVAFSLEIGELSTPVETQFGFHIIKVTDRRSPEPQPQLNVS